MTRPVLVLVLAFLSVEATYASILDRIQYLAPGLTARIVCEIQPGIGTCAFQADPNGQTVQLGPYDSVEVGALHDAQGQLYGMDHRSYSCESTGVTDGRVFRVNPDNTVEMILVFDGCISPKTGVFIRELSIDAINGKALLRAGSGRDTESLIEISGLPTLLDIILSYQPPSTLSFNVPVRPEGLHGADSFSVYSGDVRTASDLSQATSLQCTVPVGRPPIAGEHLTVPDTLPDPTPGDTRYYVAAVNYQGQRRAGRTSMNGVMQGRDAAALVSCPGQ